MRVAESSIFVNIKELRKLLYQAQFSMAKSDRVIYGTPIMEHCAKSLQFFVLAYLVKDRRIAYLEECIGWFSVLRIDMEFCVLQNIFKFPKDGNHKTNMFALVAKIDNDISKWRTSLTKGKTITA